MPYMEGRKVAQPCHHAVDPIIKVIEERRRERDLTDAQLGEISGVSSTTLSQWRVGRCSPSVVNARAVLQVVGLRLAIVPSDHHVEGEIEPCSNS